jgi:hypothetical protein
MAPEQIERPSEVDSRADLYSLGVIFYEMLTGELPLGRFPLPSQKAHTDVKLDQVVLRALEKEPRLRYQQAAEILIQVEQFSAPGMASARSRSMTSLLQFGIVGALVLVAALSYALVHIKSKPNVITEIITNTNTVTNTVTITNSAGGRGRGGFFTPTPDGLTFNSRVVSELKLNQDQIQVVNSIIRTTERDYLQIERKHADRSVDAAGHVHVVITPIVGADSSAIEKMGEQLWKELGGVLTPVQLDSARSLSIERALLPATANRTTNIVEMWKDAAGFYHFTDTTESARGGEISNTRPPGTNFNAIIPARFWPYWTENN